jgi:peptidoglycan hydrolase-like protein with peptidoglycan-binding domain
MPLTSARFSRNTRLQNASNNQPPIRRGETDKRAVEILQQCFVELGFDMPRSTKPNGLFDGIFGAETEQVAKSFQLTNGLSPDGVIGRDTLARLDFVFAALVVADEAQLKAELASPHGGWAVT